MSKPVQTPEEGRQEEVAVFMRYVFFFLFYFACLLLIASFGVVAET